jgi:hypothetical protein
MNDDTLLTSLPSSRRRALLAGLLLPAITLPACGGGGGDTGTPMPPPLTEPRFTPDGLDGRIVRRLKAGADAQSTLYAGTDQGVWRRRSGGGWQALGPANHTVLDFVLIDAQTLLVAAQRNDPVPAYALLETRDGGTSWQALAHDFGGDEGPEPVRALHWQASTGRLLATGTDVLAESTDRGRRWRRLSGQWQAFGQPKDALAVEPTSGDIWYGGQDAIEGAWC